MIRAMTLASVLIGTFTASGVAQPPPEWEREDWKTDFDKHTVPFDEIVGGGPPKDGIPAIDAPRFTSVDDADEWLDDRELVMVVAHAGEVRVYPIQILIYHEIVNDRIGDLPIAVTYCPLCNTAITFDRRFDGRVLDFGTTGKLRHSDLVMYDRQTETWWQQASGEGLVGEYAGRELIFVPSRMHDWRTVRTLHPNARVLSRETGHNRPYGRNPYEQYDRSPGPFSRFFRRETDDRLPAMERVVAIRNVEEPVAYPFSELREARVVNDEIDRVPVVVFWVPGAASSVDARSIADGREVGSTAVFDRRAGEQILTFDPSATAGSATARPDPSGRSRARQRPARFRVNDSRPSSTAISSGSPGRCSSRTRAYGAPEMKPGGGWIGWSHVQEQRPWPRTSGAHA